MRAGGSDTGWAELQWAAYRCCPHAGSTTWAQSAVLMRGRATRHSCRMMSTSLGEGLEHNGTVSGLLFTHTCRQHHWLVGWLAGCWLNLFKAELSPKRYWRGLRPQVVGKEGDYA